MGTGAGTPGDCQKAIAITGGAGAVGRHLIRHLTRAGGRRVRVLVHQRPLPPDLASDRVSVHVGDLRDRRSLDGWLERGSTVIHLAWSSSMTSSTARVAHANLAEVSATVGVTRLLHVSTATVAGRARPHVIDEDTPCDPVTDYERGKLEAERIIEDASNGKVPIIIVRPTAVFGPGLANLIALAHAITHGHAITNYARASLFGRRSLHLVPVETLVSALAFLASAPTLVRNGARSTRVLISADEEPGGDFRSVEARLRAGLGIGRRRLPAVPIPSKVLGWTLAAAGRSDCDPKRTYSSRQLAALGFRPPLPLVTAIDRFAVWYRQHAMAPAQRS